MGDWEFIKLNDNNRKLNSVLFLATNHTFCGCKFVEHICRLGCSNVTATKPSPPHLLKRATEVNQPDQPGLSFMFSWVELTKRPNSLHNQMTKGMNGQQAFSPISIGNWLKDNPATAKVLCWIHYCPTQSLGSAQSPIIPCYGDRPLTLKGNRRK